MMRGELFLGAVVVVSTFGVLLCVSDFNTNENKMSTETVSNSDTRLQAHSRKRRYVAFPLGSSFSVSFF